MASFMGCTHSKKREYADHKKFPKSLVFSEGGYPTSFPGPRSQGLFPILRGRTQDREKALGTRLEIPPSFCWSRANDVSRECYPSSAHFASSDGISFFLSHQLPVFMWRHVWSEVCCPVCGNFRYFMKCLCFFPLELRFTVLLFLQDKYKWVHSGKIRGDPGESHFGSGATAPSFILTHIHPSKMFSLLFSLSLNRIAAGLKNFSRSLSVI